MQQIPLANIARVLDAFEESDWDEIHLVSGSFELHVSVSTPGRDLAAPETSPEPVSPVVSGLSPPVGAPPTNGSWSTDQDGTVPVRCPSLGIFWRSPRPGAAPFVDVGDEVSPDSTVCIVEVMKLMTPVLAEAHGRIVQILVANGESVEQHQLLFLLAPATA